MKAFAPTLALAVLLAPVSFGASPPDPTPQLCRSTHAEGVYSVVFSDQSPGRIALVCLGGGGHMAASLSVGTGQTESAVPMPFASEDGQIVSFTSFDPSPSQAGKIPPIGNLSARLQLQTPALFQGQIIGRFETGYGEKEIESAQKIQSFPDFFDQANHAANYANGLGLFHFTAADGTPGTLDIDVIDGTQRITYASSGHSSQFLADGLPAAKAGNSFYATSGTAGGGSTFSPLIQVRGISLHPNEVLFYYFRSGSGMQGPFRGKR